MKKYIFISVICALIIVLLLFQSKSVLYSVDCDFIEVSMYNEYPVEKRLTNKNSIEKCLDIVNNSLKYRNLITKKTNQSPDVMIRVSMADGSVMCMFLYGNVLSFNNKQYTILNYERLYDDLCSLR